MQTRNQNIDIAKAFACIGVVVMHCSFPGEVGKLVAYLCKFAVPLFFMVSGYFLISAHTTLANYSSVMRRKAWHIFKILITAELLSMVYFIGKSLLQTGSYDSSLTIPDIFINLFTGTFFNGTLWFLYALLFGYLIISITPPYNILKIRKIKGHSIIVAVEFSSQG